MFVFEYLHRVMPLQMMSGTKVACALHKVGICSSLSQYKKALKPLKAICW
jgi:hypothetical protein